MAVIEVDHGRDEHRRRQIEAAEGGDIRYYTDYSGRVQINANDIARFFEESYPGYTLQYVTFKDAPTYGSLYYNY